MITRENLSKFIRYYTIAYRTEHDIDWIKPDASFWSYELAVQPTQASELPLLRTAFKGTASDINESTGELVCKGAFEPISNMPVLENIVGRLDRVSQELVGATFQIQLLFARNDTELEEGFNREQKWQWLISSQYICELFILGEIGKDGLVFTNCYHSCHQADLNRDIGEDVENILKQWEKIYEEVAVAYEIPSDAAALMSVLNPENYGPSKGIHRYPSEGQEEADYIVTMCKLLGIHGKREISQEKNVLNSNLGIIELTDIIYNRRYARAYQLFGSDTAVEEAG